MTDDARKLILKYGKDIRYKDGRKYNATVVCQGCGKDIMARHDCGVEYVVRKGGDASFWHSTHTLREVWNSKIK